MKLRITPKNRMLNEQKFVVLHIHRLSPNFEIGSLVGRNQKC